MNPHRRPTSGLRWPLNRSIHSKKQQRERAEVIAFRLNSAYPHARCSLDFESPFQLLIATILSAQCTDKRVNSVTPDLFHRWPTPKAMADASQAQIEAVIHSTGFFRAKAKNIRGCCQKLTAQYGGEVPRSMHELVSLPGVGRKTANVVLGSGFGQAVGVVVDTHVGRIARRLRLTRHVNPVQVEHDLAAVFPQQHWIALSHLIIEHGRTVCQARTPHCEACVLADLCPRVGVKTATGATTGRNTIQKTRKS